MVNGELSQHGQGEGETERNVVGLGSLPGLQSILVKMGRGRGRGRGRNVVHWLSPRSSIHTSLGEVQKVHLG